MAASRDLRSHVTDTCAICQELIKSPISLPCLHTYCLKCIEGLRRHNRPEDDVACPQCRQKFNIPESVVTGLVSNLFVASPVEARKTTSDSTVQVPCEVCLQECGDSSNVAVSTMCCVDCNEKLCEPCSRPHKRMKGRPHKVVPIGSEVEPELIQLQGGMCEKHKDQCLKLYCFDCKMNICLMCFYEEHKHHNSDDIDTYAKECVRQIDTDLTMLHERAVAAGKEISRLDAERDEYMSGVEKVRDKLARKGDELKRLIDAQVNEQTVEVQSTKSETCKKIESLRSDMETKLLALETFSKHCTELKLKGKPCDITRAADDLRKRATELRQNDVTLEDYRAPTITFIPMDTQELLDDGQNFIGRVKLSDSTVTSSSISFVTRRMKELEQQLAHNDMMWTQKVNELQTQLKQQESELEVKHVKSAGVGCPYVVFPRLQTSQNVSSAVWGVTVCDNKLFVVCRGSNSILVFGPNNQQQTNIKLEQLNDPLDIVSCTETQQLFVAGKSRDSPHCVWRVSLDGRQVTVGKWLPNRSTTTSQTQFSTKTLSVTSRRLLVTSKANNELLLYGADGVELKRVRLQDMTSLRHAVETSRGTFIVSHEKPQPRVCEVTADGHVTRVYCDQQLSNPVYLSLDSDGRIFVADFNKDRVLLLNSETLKLERVLLDRQQHQLTQRPRRLCYTQQTGQLAIGGGWSLLGVTEWYGCIQSFTVRL